MEQSKNYMGKISWSKVHCGTPRNFFGTDIKSDHPIELRISTATEDRELSKTWVFGSAKPFVRVEMTPVQWAEFLTSGNTEGIPCTIIEREGVRTDPVEPAKTIEHFEAESEETFDAFGTGADKIAETIKACLDSGKPMGKTQMAQLLRDLDTYKHNTVANLKFVKDQFKETMAKVVANAKAEVNAYVENKCMALGLEKAQLALEG